MVILFLFTPSVYTFKFSTQEYLAGFINILKYLLHVGNDVYVVANVSYLNMNPELWYTCKTIKI